MAGSSDTPQGSIPTSIQARLEGLITLAQCLDEPIVIFNPNMELVYANPSARGLGELCPLLNNQESSHGLANAQARTCEPCPGKTLFSAHLHDGENVGSLNSSSGSSSSFCPVPRAIPLGHEAGAAQYAVMMGQAGRQSIVFPAQNMSQLPIPSGERGIVPTDGPSADVSLIGESPAIQQLVEMIRLVAASEATVLIQGESGTGKELVAKTIHRLSRRRSHPFVVVECSALPDTLLESELFGHVRGAFTGAVADRKGLFEEAEGGTIFLDEIGDTSPAFQARLLRVLQEGEIRPVGSNGSIKVNVRVISAGNKPIEGLVKAKLFRADLYYRLAVLPLTVPSLRERGEDIRLLVGHFLAQSVGKHGRSSLKMSAEGYQALFQHNWPGNVRELENLIERLVVISPGPVIDVSEMFGRRSGPVEAPATTLKTVGKTARQEAERLRIVEALREAKDDRTRTARILKISRSSLYNKLRDYQIS